MSQSEQLVPLSSDEISRLKKKNGPALSRAVVVAVFLSLFTYYVVSDKIKGGFVFGKGIVDFVVLAFVVLIGALIVRSKLKSRGPLKTDIREGKKKVFVAPMESQRERATEMKFRRFGLLSVFFRNFEIDYNYFIKVNSKEYPVSMESYYELKPGSLVEIHEGPHSGQPLSVAPAKI